jgi:hypothetical protein
VRGFLHWEYAGWVIAILWGSGLAMLSIAPSLEALHVGIEVVLDVAYGCFVAAFVWSLAFWLTSDSLTKRNPANWSRQRRSRATWQDYRNYLLFIAIRCIGILVLFGSAMWGTHTMKYQLELSRLGGTLYAANDPDMLTGPCAPKGDEVALYVGTNAVQTNLFPLTIIRISKVPAVVLDRNSDGSMALTMDVRSDDGKLIARLDRGTFTVNPNNYFSMKRKDRSSLLVVDQNGEEALNARYANPHFFLLSAQLHSGGRRVNLRQMGAVGNCFVIPKGTNIGAVVSID